MQILFAFTRNNYERHETVSNCNHRNKMKYMDRFNGRLYMNPSVDKYTADAYRHIGHQLDQQ